MATTTTTSKRKKPASASKAAKATKKTKTAKVTKPAKTAAANTETSKSSRKAPLTPLERIRSLHLSSAVVYTLFAGVVIGFVSMAQTAITLTISARDEFAGQDHVVLGTAHEVLYNIDPKYVLVASLLVSALVSIFLATKLRTRYEATLAGRISGFRWVSFGLSAALTVVFLNLLVGVNDISTLKLSASAMFFAAAFSWVAERDNAKARKPRWLAYILAWVAGLAAFAPILGSLIGTTIWGAERFGWHVYAATSVIVLGYVVMAIAAANVLKAGANGRAYTGIEEAYLRADLFVKFLVVLIILTALQ